MVAGCGMKCIKFTIFFFNFLFLLIGTALIIAGAYLMATLTEVTRSIALLNYAIVFVIVVGILIFLPAFFGCCGAIRESRCMLITYAVFMGILLLVEVIIAITGFVFGMKARAFVENQLGTTMDNYGENVGVMVVWGLVQDGLDCCGMHSPNDWRNKPMNSTSVPDTCCRIPGCNTTNILEYEQSYQDEVINTKGCLNDAEAKLKSILYVVCGVALAIASIELIGIIFAACYPKLSGQRVNTAPTSQMDAWRIWQRKVRSKFSDN